MLPLRLRELLKSDAGDVFCCVCRYLRSFEIIMRISGAVLECGCCCCRFSLVSSYESVTVSGVWRS